MEETLEVSHKTSGPNRTNPAFTQRGVAGQRQAGRDAGELLLASLFPLLEGLHT